MYTNFLFIHSWLRWLVIVFLVVLLFKFTYSLWQKKLYTKFDRVLSSVLLGSVHLQLLLGLILYFALSPTVQAGLSNMQVTMKNHTLRYWTVEHVLSMIVFAGLVQVGFSLSKRAQESAQKHKLMLVYTLIGFIILMATIPWPFMSYGRPLFQL